MTKIWAISTNKGGVLKTSISTNLAGVLSKNNKVLIVDTDNQGNSSLTFGKNPDLFECSLYDVLIAGVPAQDGIINVYENIDVLPSNDDMSFFEFDCLTEKEKYPQPFKLLKEALVPIKDNYDFILIDTPPNLGLTQGNVLSVADSVLIPFQPESYSMRSLIKILNAINGFKQKHNPVLSILGVVATLVDQRTTLHSEVLQECRKFCLEHDIKLYNTVIPKSVRFAASVAYEGLPATLTEKNNPLVSSYFDLMKEIEILIETEVVSING